MGTKLDYTVVRRKQKRKWEYLIMYTTTFDLEKYMYVGSSKELTLEELIKKIKDSGFYLEEGEEVVDVYLVDVFKQDRRFRTTVRVRKQYNWRLEI